MENKKTFLIHVDEKVHHEFKVACARAGCTMSEVLRGFMAAYVNEKK